MKLEYLYLFFGFLKLNSTIEKGQIGIFNMPTLSKWSTKHNIPHFLGELKLVKYNSKEVIKGKFIGCYSFNSINYLQFEVNLRACEWIKDNQNNIITADLREETIIEGDIRNQYYLKDIKIENNFNTKFSARFNFISLYETKDLLYKSYCEFLRPLVREIQPNFNFKTFCFTNEYRYKHFKSAEECYKFLQLNLTKICKGTPKEFYGLSEDPIALYSTLKKSIAITEDLYNLSILIYNLYNSDQKFFKKFDLLKEVTGIFELSECVELIEESKCVAPSEPSIAEESKCIASFNNCVASSEQSIAEQSKYIAPAERIHPPEQSNSIQLIDGCTIT